MNNFIAIDFETANEKRYSPCSMGIVKIENGFITENRYFLIRPPEMRFNPRNIAVHGIMPEEVRNQQEFDELWSVIQPYFEGANVIAHNAAFDISVLRQTLEYYDIPLPNINYYCTLKMSKKIWPDAPSHKLDYLAKQIGVQFSHHHALEDAEAAACLALHFCDISKTSTVKELCDSHKIKETFLRMAL